MAFYDALSSIQATFMLYILRTFDSVAWRRQRGATSRAV
jgi:hypothetical protein